MLSASSKQFFESDNIITAPVQMKRGRIKKATWCKLYKQVEESGFKLSSLSPDLLINPLPPQNQLSGNYAVFPLFDPKNICS